MLIWRCQKSVLEAPRAGAADSRCEAKIHYNSENPVSLDVGYDLLTYLTSPPESAIHINVGPIFRSCNHQTGSQPPPSYARGLWPFVDRPSEMLTCRRPHIMAFCSPISQASISPLSPYCYSSDVFKPYSLFLKHFRDLFSYTLQIYSGVSNSTCGDSRDRFAACLD